MAKVERIKLSKKTFLSGLKPRARSSKISRRARILKLQKAFDKKRASQLRRLTLGMNQIEKGFSKRVVIGGVPAQLRLTGRTKAKGFVFGVFTTKGESLNRKVTVPKGAGLKI